MPEKYLLLNPIKDWMKGLLDVTKCRTRFFEEASYHRTPKNTIIHKNKIKEMLNGQLSWQGVFLRDKRNEKA